MALTRISILKKKFPKQDFSKFYKMKLLKLTRKRALVSMSTYEGMWTDFGLANGFTLGPVANAAGVFLAMANSKFFTPLSKARELKWLRPTLKNIDKKIFASASVIGKKIKEFKSGPKPVIIIKIEVAGADGKIKMEGILEYILLSKEYKRRQ